MGDNGIIRTDEDELTAIHLKEPAWRDAPGDKQAVRQVILAGGEVASGFMIPPGCARLGHRPEDVEIGPRYRPLRFCHPPSIVRRATGRTNGAAGVTFAWSPHGTATSPLQEWARASR